MSTPVRVLMLTQYPLTAEDERLGGIMQASFRLVRALAALDDSRIELSVATESAGVSAPTLVRLGRGTSVTYYPRSRGFLDRVLFGYPNARRILAQAAERVRPDIVHAQGAANYIYAAVRSKLPHIVTIHGLYRNEMRVAYSKPGVPGWIARHGKTFLEEIYATRMDNLIAITDEVAQFVRNRSRGARIFRIDNPIDADFFRIEPLSANGQPTVLFVAAITYRKGLDYLLEAFMDVLRRVPAARLRIAGIWHWDPEYVSGLRNRYSDQVARGSVSFLGGISQEQLLREMGDATVLCVPSRSESAPLVISQAMAAGRPVIASRIGGIPGMVEEGRTGRLWELGDLRALADLLVDALADREGALRMGEAARAVALGRYGDRAVAARTVAAYLQVSVGSARGRQNEI
jgi:glycosyltransferase involved in cell wall biosynthesis